MPEATTPVYVTSEEAVFLAALELTVPEERMAYIDSACGGCSELRVRVLELLESHEEPQGAFDIPPTALAFDPLSPLQGTETVGTMIGPYKIREVLGEGGMGIVYAATQERPLRRKVAIKVIKPGMDSKEVIGRFEAERQALALMDHPNIAKVFEAGTTESGRPYFVMELVRGMPITDYCDRASVTLRERLKLFITVCQSIQHAHQKGIIHRDLKPSNILVTLHDGVPVPKVIDFGVAKAMNQRLTEHTVYTQNAQMVGTPMYMSPEQAELSGLDVDTRSDVYALGVLLYELLAGAAPFDRERFSRVSFDEMRRMIREDEPPRPSQRVSTMEAKVLSTVSGKRGLDERKLTQSLKGELDWIVMKALEKDRQRRYESASAFATDVQRYLDDEPVDACPPSAAYRLRKFARRNRLRLVTAMFVSTALVIGTAVSSWQAFEATSARKLADERLVLADNRLVLADVRLESEKKARADADEQRQLASANLQQALDAVDQMLLRVADERLAAIPGAEHVRQELHQDALKFYEAFFQQAPDDPQLRISTAKAWTRVGSLHDILSNRDKAQEARQAAIQRWEALFSENPDDVKIQLALAEVILEFGHCEQYQRSKFASAETAYKRALLLYHALERHFPDNLDYPWKVTNIELNLADNYRSTGRFDLAEQTLRHVVDVQRNLWNREVVSSKRHLHLSTSLNALMTFMLDVRKQEDEAESLCKESIRCAEEVVPCDPQSLVAATKLVQSFHHYANFLSRKRRFAEAEQNYRRAVEAGRIISNDSPHHFHLVYFLAYSEVELANLLAADGRHADALQYYGAASDSMRPAIVLIQRFSRWDNLCEKADQGLDSSLKQLANDGHLDDARRFCEELTKGGFVTGTVAILSRFRAMRAWECIGELDRSKQLKDDLIKELKLQNPDSGHQRERDSLARAIFIIADREFQLSRYDDALPLLDQAIRWNPNDSEMRDHRGQIFLERGKNEVALADLDVAIDQGPKYGASTYHKRARTRFRLGQYSGAMADLMQASQISPSDVRHLDAIDPAEVAACADENFRKNYVAWFQQASAAITPTAESRLNSTALQIFLHHSESATGDLEKIAGDASVTVRNLSHAAILALRLGNHSSYRKISSLLVGRDAKSLDPAARWIIPWTAAIGPNAMDDYGSAISVAKERLALDPLDRLSYLALGNVLYRAGQYEEALDSLTQSENSPTNSATPPVYGHYFLAMAHKKLGHDAEAKQWYEKALAATEQALASKKTEDGEPLPWFRLTTLELLRAEAKAMFEELPKGEKLSN